MLEYEDSGYKIQEFSCFAEVANYIENTPYINEYNMVKPGKLRTSFHGVNSFDGMLDRIRFGDKVQTEFFIKEIKAPNDESDCNTGVFMDIEGFAYDMGSVINGEPECCVNFGSPETKPSLNIYIDIGYCGKTDVKTINYRGIAITKLINSLLAKGYILNVYVVHYITTEEKTENGRMYAQLFKIPTDYLTISTIAYSCTCDFFRVVTWLLTAIQMKLKSYTGQGKSMPERSILDAIKKRGDLYIPSGYTDGRFNYCSKEEAEKLVFDCYEKYCESKGGKMCS